MSSKLFNYSPLDLDCRSLALLRICYGILVILDLGNRLFFLEAFYTDQGVLPRDFWISNCGWPEWISLHGCNGSSLFQSLVFGLHLSAAAALTLGWKTRWSGLLTWFLLCSLHSRNPMILHSGDTYLRVILFWGLFLPWGEVWSLDGRSTEETHNPIANLAYLTQVSLVYWFAVIPKSGPSWTVTYEAAELALRIDQFVRPIGELLLSYPEQLKWITFLIWWFEALGPFLLFLPILRGHLRTAAVFLFMVLHLSFAMTLELGLFGYIGAASVAGLIPGSFWVELGHQEEPRPTAKAPWPLQAALGLLLLGVVLQNFGNENTKQKWFAPSQPASVMRLLRLDQRWNVFSPGPLLEDGWYVLVATDQEGKQTDLLKSDRVLDWEKPERVADQYPDDRWRKYLMNLWLSSNEQHRGYYTDYMLRLENRNRDPGKKVTRIDMVFILEKTRPGGVTDAPRSVLLWSRWLEP